MPSAGIRVLVIGYLIRKCLLTKKEAFVSLTSNTNVTLYRQCITHTNPFQYVNAFNFKQSDNKSDFENSSNISTRVPGMF